MTYITTYIIISIITMIFFIERNRKQIEKNYMELEEENSGEPSNGWFNFYIFTHILKAPLMFVKRESCSLLVEALTS